MASAIDFIGSYFYRAAISGEPQLSANIPRASGTTFHQQHIINKYFVEIPFFGSLPQKKNMSIYFFKK